MTVKLETDALEEVCEALVGYPGSGDTLPIRVGDYEYHDWGDMSKYPTIVLKTNTSMTVNPYHPASEWDSQAAIIEDCDAIKELLLEKNRKYGDSALNPSRIFSRADAVEQIKVRIDDKLTRFQNRQDDEDEDIVQDLIGYLHLLRIAKKKAEQEATPAYVFTGQHIQTPDVSAN